MAVATALRLPAAASLVRHRATAARCLPLRPLASASSTPQGGGSRDGGGKQHQRQLVLYSKPGCCLCEGLKEKLEAAFLLGGPHSLATVQLQVRDITVNPEWEQLYQYEIPVLACVLPDGSEKILPRLSPRLGVELIQRKISSAFED